MAKEMKSLNTNHAANEKPISLAPLTVEQALRIAMRADPKAGKPDQPDKGKKRKAK
ncbi:hypothetical protein HED60_04065 [Planctomycetales bacterium ZRK34]|nr:hypothetical protein HED60_04065 [Planctomycetales bacterium ZRK34]